MPSNLLAIAIPTYNRAVILEQNIRAMLPEIIKLSLPLYLSDDSNTDSTAEVVARLREEYPHIHYRRNVPGLGHDKNFVSTICLPSEDYVWFLSDSSIVEAGALEAVYAVLLDQRPDMLFVNAERRCDDTQEYTVSDIRDFIRKRAWHLTLTGATVYSRAAGAVSEEEVAQWRNFPQLGLILRYCLSGNRKLIWMGSMNVLSNKSKKSYWAAAVIDTFVVDWINVIKTCSTSYSDTDLRGMILSHSLHTKLFGLMNLIRHRANGALSLSSIRTNREGLQMASQTSYGTLLIIAATPRAVCRFIVSAHGFLRQTHSMQ
jgi:abequosyltransferase